MCVAISPFKAGFDILSGQTLSPSELNHLRIGFKHKQVFHKYYKLEVENFNSTYF
jgi:hypothetical protein